MLFEKNHKIGFQGKEKTYKTVLSAPYLQLILTLHAMYTSLFANKTEFLLYFDAGLKHMATRIVVTGVMLIG